MTSSEVLETRGHLMDSGVLARVLDDVLAYGGDYRIDRLDVGRAHDDESYARLVVSADTDGHFRLIEKRNQLSIERERVPGFEPIELAVPGHDPNGGVKGKRKSKKDKLREAAAREGEKKQE